MRRAVALAAALALAACAGGHGRFRGESARALRPIAEPGEVVAAELSFAQSAQENGQWTAFAKFAADEAVMFEPSPVMAKAWLKGRPNPAKPLSWEPYNVWSSCDGTLAATRGAWQGPGETFGYYTTIWARQKDGNYKWVLDMGDKLKAALGQPEMVQADVADCPARPARRGFEDRSGRKRNENPLATIAGTPSERSGKSADGTLAFSSSYASNGVLTLTVSLAKGGAMKNVIDDRVAP